MQRFLLLVTSFLSFVFCGQSFNIPDFAVRKISIRENSARLKIISSLNIPAFTAAIALPSSLGFAKREYGVSYGYGGSIAAAGFVALKSISSKNNLAVIHAALHIVYGIRLCLFLLYRELSIPAFREMREKIEKNSPQQRMDRAPFIIQCAALYALMSFPVLITSSMQPLPIGSTAELIMKVILGTATVGLASQIVGDTHKSVAKARGETLVTSGLFSVLRHPNYTGETILWVSSAAAGVLAAVVATQKTWTVLALAGGSVFGAIGIGFILAMATSGLERRQKEKYGATQIFQNWRKTTWGGLQLPTSK